MCVYLANPVYLRLTLGFCSCVECHPRHSSTNPLARVWFAVIGTVFLGYDFLGGFLTLHNLLQTRYSLAYFISISHRLSSYICWLPESLVNTNLRDSFLCFKLF